MDFSLSAEEAEFKQQVVDFARKQLCDVRDGLSEHEFSWAGWKTCAEFGIQALPYSEEFGGLEKDVVASMLAMQALGYGCADSGLLFALNSHLWTCGIPIRDFGSEQQQRRYLPRMAAGEIVGCHGMTEPDSGSDAFNLSTTATKTETGYVLNGSKTFVSNAPIADVFLIFATTNPARGWAGVTAFLIDKENPGLSVGRPLEKMGLRTSPTGEVFLENCEVEETAILGKVGRGSSIFNAEMEWERACLFACHLGAMERQLEVCIDYVKEREQFGQPISQFQAVSHKIADMKMRCELAELILHKVAWKKRRGERASMESSVAKLFVSESYVASSLDAIQVHGGYGYMVEQGVEGYLRDAVGSRLYSGTSEIQRNIIARLLGL